MQITYYPGLNNNIQTLICNLPNYEFSKQFVTIIPGVQSVDDNTVKLLLLTEYFSALVSKSIIVLGGILDGNPPIYPNAKPFSNILIAGITDAGDITNVGVNTDGSLKGSGESATVDLGNKIDAATMPTGGSGNLGWLSAIYKFLTDRIPSLIGGRMPVDVSSLTVTVNNANLEISNDVGNPIPVNGSVGISGTLPAFTTVPTFNVGTPGTIATEATLSSLLTLAAFRERINTLGAKTSANSTPVVLASDQSAIPSTQSGTWNINNITGNISLPTNAATAILQIQGNASLGGIDTSLTTKIPYLGQAQSSRCIPVVLPAEQITALTPPTSVGISGTLPAFASIPTVNSVIQNRTASRTLTALGDTASIACGDLAGITAVITGTWVGTLTFQGTADGTNWISVYGYTLPDNAFSFTTTSNGQFKIDGNGFAQIRIIATTYTSGAASVALTATKDSGLITSQIRNTTLTLTSDSNSIPIKQGTGEIINVGLNAGTNTIGNVVAYQKVSLDQANFRTVSITTGTAVNTWTDTAAADTGSAAGSSLIVLVPNVTTACTNAVSLEFQIFFSNGTESNKSFENTEVLGTPSGGIVALTSAVKTWSIPLNSVQTLQGQPIVVAYKGRFMGIRWRITGAPGSSAFVAFNARFN